MKAYLRYLLAVCAVVALAIASGCATAPSQPAPKSVPAAERSDSEQVGAVLNRLADDLSHRRLQRVLNSVSDAYKDDTGRDFNGVKSFLDGYMRDYRTIQITRTPPKITVSGSEARAVGALSIIGEPDNAKVTPFSYQGRAAISLRRVEEAWQVTKVQILQ